jgi:hypothetical protein
MDRTQFFKKGWIVPAFILFLALSLGLSACGRKSRVSAPPDSTYPQDYPSR